MLISNKDIDSNSITKSCFKFYFPFFLPIIFIYNQILYFKLT